MINSILPALLWALGMFVSHKQDRIPALMEPTVCQGRPLLIKEALDTFHMWCKDNKTEKGVAKNVARGRPALRMLKEGSLEDMTFKWWEGSSCAQSRENSVPRTGNKCKGPGAHTSLADSRNSQDFVVLEKTLESPLEIKPVYPKGKQSWTFIGRTDAEAETPILWPPDAKSWLTGKDPDAGKDWGQEEKRATENEMVR